MNNLEKYTLKCVELRVKIEGCKNLMQVALANNNKNLAEMILCAESIYVQQYSDAVDEYMKIKREQAS